MAVYLLKDGERHGYLFKYFAKEMLSLCSYTLKKTEEDIAVSQKIFKKDVVFSLVYLLKDGERHSCLLKYVEKRCCLSSWYTSQKRKSLKITN